MGRLLDDNVKNILQIKDPVSGDKLGLYYRIPTTEDRVGYLKDIWDREKGGLTDNLAQARAKWGGKILEGFTDGSFIRTVMGEKRFLSSNPESPNYLDKWKEWVIEFCPDLLERLCFEIFEGYDSEATQEGPPEKK